MRSLLKILVGGFAAFMILAIVDEWAYFSQAWFGDEEPASEISEEQRRAAADTLHLCLTLMGHLYQSGGDPRFAERLPAAPWVLEEIQADIDYLARNHLRQEPELERLEVTAVETLGPDRLQLETRERWRIRLRAAESAHEAEPERVFEARGRYLLVKGARDWRVDGWDPLLADEFEESVG